MRWSFRIGSLFGIRVELHFTFLLLIVWYAMSQGLSRGDFAAGALAGFMMLLVFACVLLHELGHALAARRYGIHTRDIILLPFGGVARLEKMPDKPAQEMVVAIAGPLVNVAISGVLWLAMGMPTAGQLVASATGVAAGGFTFLLAVNVMMVVFNMIPAFPMDGGRVLRAGLAMTMPYERATRLASMVGQAFAIVFAALGAFGGNIMLMLVALFVFLAAAEERALVQTRTSLSGLPVRAAMLTQFRRLDVTDPLRRAVDHLMAGSQQDFPVVDGDVPVGVLTRAELVVALQRTGLEAPVGEVVTRDPQFADAGESLEEVVTRMRARGRSGVPVMQHGRLVGFLTLENVGDLLLVRDALRRQTGSA